MNSKESILSACAVSERLAAVQAMGNLDRQGITDSDLTELIAWLDDNDPRVAASAAASLGVLMVEEAVPALIEKLAGSPNDQVRLGAAFALGQIGKTRALPVLIARLKCEPSSETRAAIVEALELIPDDSGLNALLEILDTEPEITVRESIVLALGTIGSERAIPRLKQLRRQADAEMRPLVLCALEQIRERLTEDPAMAVETVLGCRPLWFDSLARHISAWLGATVDELARLVFVPGGATFSAALGTAASFSPAGEEGDASEESVDEIYQHCRRLPLKSSLLDHGIHVELFEDRLRNELRARVTSGKEKADWVVRIRVLCPKGALSAEVTIEEVDEEGYGIHTFGPYPQLLETHGREWVLLPPEIVSTQNKA